MPATILASVAVHVLLGDLVGGTPAEAAVVAPRVATLTFEVAASAVPDASAAPPEPAAPEPAQVEPVARRPRAAHAPAHPEDAAGPSPTEPLDFSAMGALTAPGGELVGLVAAGGGGGRRAPAAPPSLVRAGSGGGGGASRPAGLEARRWDCPWPARAEALQIASETVLLRATVAPDGRALAVDVVSDPGHGFGEAARRCALRARFDPALDDAGRPVRATTPPIRVRFVRPDGDEGEDRLAAR